MSINVVAESSAVPMNESRMRTLLTEEGVGILALPDDDIPYVVPMSFGYDGESTLYFVFMLFGAESRKSKLAEDADRARFLVHRAESVTDWRSVSLTGRIDSLGDDEWDALRGAMENAWHPNVFSSAHPMRGIEGYRFRIDSWTGIEQGDGRET